MRGGGDIGTARLRLVSLPVGCLEAFRAGDREGAEEAGGFTVPPDSSLLGDEWIDRRLRMIADDPRQLEWLYRAIVRRSDNLMLGFINFHHMAPDPDLARYSANGAELGYTIEEPHRRLGYGRESAEGMIGWAGERGVEDFFLSIGPDNAASLRLAASLRFEKIDERMDDVDGLEYVFTRHIGRRAP